MIGNKMHGTKFECWDRACCSNSHRRRDVFNGTSRSWNFSDFSRNRIKCILENEILTKAGRDFPLTRLALERRPDSLPCFIPLAPSIARHDLAS